MSTLVSKATGNLTAAGSWNLALAVTNAEVDNETSTVNVTTSNQDSSTFTPALNDNIIKVGIKINNTVTPTGTLNIILRNSTLSTDIKTITVNASDLPATGWFYVSFSAVVADGATAYLVRFIRSVADGASNRITLYASSASAANICRSIVLATTQAPAAGDKLIVATDYTAAATSSGTYVITPDDTSAVSYGPTWSSDAATPGGIQVSKGGKIDWDTTASATRFLKWKGRFVAYDQGVIGTVSTRIPSTSTLKLIMDSAANVDAGIVLRPGSTWYGYGAVRSNVMTYLNGDEAAAQTVFVVDDATGWADADELVIGDTSTVGNQSEIRVIAGGGISGSTITVTAGLTNSHTGTAPYKAEVANVTRNFKIYGISSSLQGYFFADTTAVVVMDYVEIKWLGSGTTSKRGIDLATTTGSATITNCGLHEFIVASSQGIVTSAATANNITISSNVMFNTNANTRPQISINLTSGTSIVIDSNWCFTTSSQSGSSHISISTLNLTFTNNVIVGGISGGGDFGFGLRFALNSLENFTGTISGNTVHSSANGAGLLITGNNSQVIQNTTMWNANISPRSNGGQTIDGLDILNGGGFNLANTKGCRITVKNANINGCTNAISIGAIGMVVLRLINVDFGDTGGGLTANTTDISIAAGSQCFIDMNNCFLRDTELSGQTSMGIGSYISSQKHDQTVGLHKTICPVGTLTIETTTFNTASPSLKMTPLGATARLDSGAIVPGAGMMYRILNGGTISPSVYVREINSYDGQPPRLIAKANPAIGFNSDQVLATYDSTGDANSGGGTSIFHALSGTTSAATDDGMVEVVVDCGGTGYTTGDVVVDDWGPNVGNALKNWFNGLPSQDVFPAAGGGGGGIVIGG